MRLSDCLRRNGATLRTKATQRSQLQDFLVLLGRRCSVRPGRRGCGTGFASTGCFSACAAALVTVMRASVRFDAMISSADKEWMSTGQAFRMSSGAEVASGAVALHVKTDCAAWSEVRQFALARRIYANSAATSALSDCATAARFCSSASATLHCPAWSSSSLNCCASSGERSQTVTQRFL